MAKWKKTVVAGNLVMEAIYPRINSNDAPKVRAEKRKLSTEAQKRINLKYSWQKLMFMLAANFKTGDLVVCLTFDDEHLPESRKQCAAAFKQFRTRLKAAYKKDSQPEPVIVWCFENKHSAGRWHIHCVMSGSGQDYDIVRRCWTWGSEIDIEELKVDKAHGYYEGLARYMCKEYPDKVGQRCWSYTRNAAKPERDTQRVDDDTSLQRPRGSHEIETTNVRTDYGNYQFLFYLLPGWECRTAKPRRRRHSKLK